MFAARLMVTETGEVLVKPEFALVELLFFKSEHEKSDAETVEDWESEGGTSTHLHEEAPQIERAYENTSRNVD